MANFEAFHWNFSSSTNLFFSEEWMMTRVQFYFRSDYLLEKPLRKSENGVGPMRQLCLKQKASEISSSLYSSN